MRSPSVMFVDDDPVETHPYEMYLKKAVPCDVVRAHSGEEALDLAEAHSFDLVLLDAVMKPMDGFETCEALRKMRRYRTTPIVILTKLLEGGADERRAMRVGASGYVHKPVKASELAALVKSILIQS